MILSMRKIKAQQKQPTRPFPASSMNTALVSKAQQSPPKMTPLFYQLYIFLKAVDSSSS